MSPECRLGPRLSHTKDSPYWLLVEARCSDCVPVFTGVVAISLVVELMVLVAARLFVVVSGWASSHRKVLLVLTVCVADVVAVGWLTAVVTVVFVPPGGGPVPV